MGLDVVELVVKVETAFGITISNEDAPKIITVGQLYRYVLARLPSRETQRCLSATAFYHFRRALTDQLGVDRRDVGPSALIEGLVLEAHRRSEWQRLGRRLDWRLPPLVRPTWMMFAFFGLWSGSLAALAAAWGWTIGFNGNALAVFVICALHGTIPVLAVAFSLTTPFATRFPRECRTVKGAVLAALALNYGKISNQGPGWNRREVWECLRAVVVEVLGVAPEEVVESAEFVNDLGAD